MEAIYHSKTEEYSRLDPMLINFLDIMDNYGKAILIKEHTSCDIFINEVAQNIFAFPIEDSYIKLFLDQIEFMNTVESKKQKTININSLNLKIETSFKQIIEDDLVKYTICTLEKIIKLENNMKTSKPQVTVIKDIIGESDSITHLKNNIKKVSKTDSSVLLVGETGAGKEMFAKAIHRISNRKDKPFVAINCGAIPETLIESELFGYEKGAFTGANQQGKLGKFEQASGGTIFLDEIENMSMLLQMKLLRVLEERKVTRVGGHKEISIDVRIISATNYNLVNMIQSDEFRLDLYYRLNIIKLNIPSLRERQEDILLLSKHFIKIFSNTMRKEIIDLSDEVKNIFLNHTWDGNVRELRNAIEYAMNFEESNIITKQSLPEQFIGSTLALETNPVFIPISKLEKDYIKKALDYYGWDDKGRQEAAKVLEISRSSIYRKISSK